MLKSKNETVSKGSNLGDKVILKNKRKIIGNV